jgi:hypothetical protein
VLGDQPHLNHEGAHRDVPAQPLVDHPGTWGDHLRLRVGMRRRPRRHLDPVLGQILRTAPITPALTGDLGIARARLVQRVETTNFIQDCASADHEQRSPFGLVHLAVDEPKGDRVQGKNSKDSPKTDLTRQVLRGDT